LSQKQDSQQSQPSAASAQKPSEKTGIARFFKEMGSALVMALVAIVYVIQAFQIPTGSMEDSLLAGDFLLGLKFVYGAPLVPFSQKLGVSARFPAVAQPKPGDVVIFKYPGTDQKDYIKRMVAGPGDTVEFAERRLVVNGRELAKPPRGKYMGGGKSDLAPLYIPAKGDVFLPDTLPIREFLFFKHLVHQENPTKNVSMRFDLYVDGELANNAPLNFINGRRTTLADLQSGKFIYDEIYYNEEGQPLWSRSKVFDLNSIDNWTVLHSILDAIVKNFPDQQVELVKKLFINNVRVTNYTVRFDNYFMMGDNRDNSLDSRYWGYLNKNFVKAKAFILYFSIDRSEPLWKLPLIIRWNRIGKLIRDWDGVQELNGKIKY